MTGQSKFGWGLIGIGRHADRFIAPAINKCATGELVAVYSRDRARSSEFAAKHGCVAAYDSLEQMLGDKNVSAVFVCSPNHVHKEQVIQAAAARKHVLCEKPLALSAADCRAMIDACRSAGVKLAVGFHLRHNPVHIAARDIVHSGILGQLQLADVQYMHVITGAAAGRPSAPWRRDPKLAGGGSFLSTGTHALDLLRFVLKREVSQLSAMADDAWRVSKVERLIQISLLFEGHLIATLSAGPMKYPQNQLILYGSSATLHCQGSIGNYGGGSLEVISDQGNQVTQFDTCDVYERELDAFFHGVNGEDDTTAWGEDGWETARVSEAVYESLQKQATVKLLSTAGS
jgi:1,5-anhydro-D-fructose reductase (1,5-anhydro-D-mannitol-forming)